VNNPYNREYFNKQFLGYAFSKEKRKIFQYHLNILFSMKNKIKTVLDIGCAFGYFLSLCDKVGIKTYGLEVSDYAVNEAKKYTQAEIRKPVKLNSLFINERFDVITAFDVLEHLNNDKRILKFAYDRLKTDGILYGTTPNAKYFLNRLFGEADPTHINVHGAVYWFNLLRDIGFRDIKIKYIFAFGFPPNPALRAKMGVVYIKPIFIPLEVLGQEILFIATK